MLSKTYHHILQVHLTVGGILALFNCKIQQPAYDKRFTVFFITTCGILSLLSKYSTLSLENLLLWQEILDLAVDGYKNKFLKELHIQDKDIVELLYTAGGWMKMCKYNSPTP